MNSDALIKPTRFEPHRPGASRLRPSFSGKRLGVAALLLLCVSATWFLFTARAVYIETEPAEATPAVDGLLKLKLLDRYLLLPGRYELRITAEGYHPLEQEVVVGDEQNQRLSYRLERLPGHLHVDSGPVSGAQVFVDDDAGGRTPVTIRDLPHGEHRIRVELERYFPHEQSVEIGGLGKEQALRVELRPAWAEVSLKSEPQGAQVTVDDELFGQTPLTAEILEGRRLVRVKLPGYKDWQDNLKIVAGQPLTLDLALEPADAVVFLASNPPGASATVDGVYKGLTPLELALSPGEPATVRLFKQGYAPASRSVSVKSGDREQLTVALQPILVRVDVNVVPPDASVFVDGKERGAGNRVLELTASRHAIAVRREGYVDYETEIELDSGIDQRLDVRLKSIRQAQEEAVKPLMRTGDDQTLKLFRPGKFTMGASRREPGRRANETLRTVTLTRPFYLALHEVTNGHYKAFDSSHSSGDAQGHSLDGERQPVVSITWEQAALYCNWLSERDSLKRFYVTDNKTIKGIDPSANGYRLPTEAEWEWAARVTGSGDPLKFPWGNAMPPPKGSGNFADETASSIVGEVIRGYDDGFTVTAPVGSFTPTASGLFDMGGNVAEWTHDFYDIGPGGDVALVDPMGPGSGEFHAIRGSSWAHGGVTELRCSYRDYANQPRPDVGFRIARYAH
jgi:formylglycine-generating enzyme required for sulfatase activity